MSPLLQLYLVTFGALLIFAWLLQLLGRLGSLGRRMGDALCRAPLLDLVLFYFTALPIIIGAVLQGWAGLAVGLFAQLTALLLWMALHELTHPHARKGPRIYRTLNGIVGTAANILGVWWTAWAVPTLWMVRITQYCVYPMLTWTVRFPKYKQSEWVNLSRQKFTGLIGYDLIWCLFCDWMTGVWSLGSDMLRNVESFWCPIRFYEGNKCDNCVGDFPDIDNGWVAADGTMQDVTKVLGEKYKKGDKVHPWYGHATRLTAEDDVPKASEEMDSPPDPDVH